MTSTWIVLLLFINLTAASGLVGITNFNMYWPHTCTSACESVYSSVYLACSTIDATGEMVTSDTCRLTNEQYMSSLAWCWEVQCQNYSISFEDFQKAWKISLENATFTFEDALAIGRPSELIDKSTRWLNTSMLPVQSYYYPFYKTTQEFYQLEKWHAIFGVILICIPWLLVILGFLNNIIESTQFISRNLPVGLRIWIRKHILVPALFKEKSNVPLHLTSKIPFDYVPPRIVSIAIVIYYAINVIFCSVNYSSFPENLWWDTRADQIMTYVSNRTGVLSFVNLPILILFASRNNIFQWMTGWSYATFQFFHRHVAFICTLQAVIHSVLYTVLKLRMPGGAATYAAEAAKPYWYWGIVATTLLCLILPLSILKLRRLSYEAFIFFHYSLAIVAIAGCKFHISRRFKTEWGYNYWLYATYAVWGFDFLTRIVRVVRLSWMGISVHATIELAESETDVLKITYSASRLQTQRCVENYYYLYFPTILPCFTSHPFTLSGWTFEDRLNLGTSKGIPVNSSSENISSTTEKNNSTRVYEGESSTPELIFYAKVQRGTTAQLFMRLEKNNFQPITLFSLVEGPYGSYDITILSKYNVVVILTGGIGRTVAQNFLNYYIQYCRMYQTKSFARLEIMNSNRNASSLAQFQLQATKLQAEFPEIMDNVSITQHDTSGGLRIDLRLFLETTVALIKTDIPGNARVGVVSCGPDKFLDVTRKTVAELQKEMRNGVMVDYVSSSFSW